jgi:hypothetical protein
MSRIYKKEYTGFSRAILNDFMSNSELSSLDEKYNQAKRQRDINRKILKQTPKDKAKAEIIDFFKRVYVDLERQVYRNSRVDIRTFNSLLKKI